MRFHRLLVPVTRRGGGLHGQRLRHVGLTRQQAIQRGICAIHILKQQEALGVQQIGKWMRRIQQPQRFAGTRGRIEIEATQRGLPKREPGVAVTRIQFQRLLQRRHAFGAVVALDQQLALDARHLGIQPITLSRFAKPIRRALPAIGRHRLQPTQQNDRLRAPAKRGGVGILGLRGALQRFEFSGSLRGLAQQVEALRAHQRTGGRSTAGQQRHGLSRTTATPQRLGTQLDRHRRVFE